jgi:hypothetical protein
MSSRLLNHHHILAGSQWKMVVTIRVEKLWALLNRNVTEAYGNS